MIRFIASVLAIIIVFAIGDWVFGIDPSVAEIVLIVVAFFVGDVVDEALK